MRILITLVSAFVATLVSAKGNATPIELHGRQIGPWNVYRLERDCWMTREARNGNVFSISTSSSDKSLYVVIRKPVWGFIKEDAALPMRVQFTGTDVTRRASGSRGDGDLVPGATVYLRDASRDYIADLRHSRVIRTWLDGRPALIVNMAGAKPALDYFAKCTALIRSAN